MSYVREVAPADIAAVLRGRMGLIIGPEITCGPRHLSELNQAIANQFSVERTDDFLHTAENAVNHGASDAELKEFIRGLVNNAPRSAQLRLLANVKWAAVLSFTLDSQFEAQLREHSPNHPLRKQIFEANDLNSDCPPGTLPVFKLLGRADRDSFAFSHTEYLARKGSWRRAVRQFADHVHGNPVLCVGMGDHAALLHDLLAEMTAGQTTAPGQLLLLADCPLRNDPAIERLLRRRSHIHVLRGGINELVSVLGEAERVGYHTKLPFSEEAKSPFAPLNLFQDAVTVVNQHLESTIHANETARLHDSLFSPEIPRWDAFVYSLDFKRTVSDHLRRQLIGQLPQKTLREAAYVLHGAAASGKTTVLKRLAFDLAKADHLVLWFGTWFFNEGTKTLLDILKAAAKLPFTKSRRLVCFIDDPYRMGAISPRELVGAARALTIDLVLIIGVRTADWKTTPVDEVTGGLPLALEEELSDALDEDEWLSLPTYLVNLGIGTSLEDARRQVDATPARTTRDTLSLLYWLLPATKAAISSSIKSEYFRLGDMSGFKRVVLDETRQSTDLLQRAYEMAAVADHYRALLPIEVLVSALGGDYSPWLEAQRGGGPAWGILYGCESEDGGACYRTRNVIVTQAIIEALNGGTISKTGEIAVLSKLLQACTGGSSVYHEFCLAILVNNARFAELECKPGRDLFDTAIEALPHECRTLLHHEARWVKNKCHDPVEAEKLLEKTFAAKSYPYSRQVELDEHIHTSVAATLIDQIDAGTLTLESGAEKVRTHLSKANASKMFLARAVHVEANLILRLMPRMATGQSADSAIIVNETFANLDRTLLVLRNPNASSRRGADDIQMLEDVRTKLFLAIDVDGEWATRANDLWQRFRSQQGFILWGRKQFESAETRDKLRDYKGVFDYLHQIIELLTKEEAHPDPMLYELLVHVYYKWRVQRAVYSATETYIDWSLLRHACERAMESTRIAANPFYKYVYALTLAHLGEWKTANALLTQIRQSGLTQDVLWLTRDFLLEANGKARQVQGVIHDSGPKQTFYCDDLKTDFHMDRMGRWNNAGEEDFAFIEFSFAGARAVDRFSLGVN